MTSGLVVGVVLAAGASSRLGRPKQLLPFRGETLLRVVVRQACASSCAAVAVVLGAHDEAIRGALQGLDVSLLSNPSWHEGMASSIRLGIAWADALDAGGALLMVCDQPRLTSTHLDRLAAAHERWGGPVASRYGGILGVPAVFPRADFSRLRELRGVQGARSALRDGGPVTALDWPDGAIDVDLPRHVARV